MENDHRLRRKYRIALNTIWVLACVVVAVLILAVVADLDSSIHKDQLKVLNAEIATGSCGNQQIVVIDEKRVAVAGRIYPPDMASTLRFEGGPDNLRVLSEQNELLMERKRSR